MDRHRVIRDRLWARAAVLMRRLQGLECEMRFGAAEETAETAQDAAEPRNLAALLAELLEAATRELALIQAAFRRMAGLEYGRCSSCDEDIPLPRLQLLPFATTCASCARDLDWDYVDQLHTQHLGLRQLLHAIEHALRAQSDRASCAVAPVGAVQLLGDLSRELSKHFQLEEMGGYLSEVLMVAPRLTKRVRELRADHADFTRQSARLLERALAAGSEVEGWREVHDRFAKFSDDMIAHELAETAIIAEAFMTDLGQGD